MEKSEEFTTIRLARSVYLDLMRYHIEHQGQIGHKLNISDSVAALLEECKDGSE